MLGLDRLPPLPPLAAAELARIHVEIEAAAAKNTPAMRRARQWRWRRLVIREGGKGLRSYARTAFAQDKGLVMLFDAQEATRG